MHEKLNIWIMHVPMLHLVIKEKQTRYKHNNNKKTMPSVEFIANITNFA